MHCDQRKRAFWRCQQRVLVSDAKLDRVPLRADRDAAVAATKTSLTQRRRRASISPVKKRDLLRQLAEIARAGGVGFRLLREGRNHEIWVLGSERLVIPRHREINEHTARGILAEAGKMVES